MSSLLLAPLLSALLCGLVWALAKRWQWLDLPNGRSSHQRATPHGGGIGLLLAFAVLVLAREEPWAGDYLVLLGLSLGLMLLGALDDRWSLPVLLRLAAYAGACLALVLSAPHPAGFWWAWLALPLMLWLVNLYNFMDGIDGLAALQALLAAASIAVLAWLGGHGEYARYCALLAACIPGFLCWNWPPARLFMGDAGSIPLGFLLGGLAWLGWVQESVPPGCWAVLLAVFVSDSTFTLLSRWYRGARITEAHREHAYQRLARHWASHARVDLLLMVIYLAWLLPLTLTIWWRPEFQASVVLLAYFPLWFGMVIIRRLP
ncbi:MAG: glycosyl transferase family 4 [Haliea sp.]|nr:glycosyl transferase family 4 [Haliea sp.]